MFKKKVRFLLRLGRALVGKYYLAIIMGLVLGGIIFIFVPSLIPYLPKFRQTHAIAVVGRFTQGDIPLSIQQKISIGLTTISPDGTAAPALASKWEVKDGGKTYVFTLDETKTWQDGSTIQASDIRYNFKDTIVEYPDPKTLVVRLNDPFSPLPVVMARPVFKKGLLGAGKYKVASLKKNGQIVESLIIAPLDTKSELPRIKYLFYPSEQQARTAFKLGLVQSLHDVQETAEIATWPNVKLESQVRYDRYVGVLFNTQDPFFTGQSGKNLRLALAYAIDKDRWPDRAYGPINPNSWAYNTELKRYDFDLKHSQNLLSKVEKLPPEIVISTTPAYLGVAESIKADWEKLGLPVRVTIAPDFSSDFSVLVFAQAIPSDPDQYNLWHSTQSTNLTKFANPRIDKLLEDGRTTLDTEDRQELYISFQRFLVEDVPAIFLFHPTTYNLTRP